MRLPPDVKKRVLDLTLCLTALPILLPLSLVLALMVRLSSPGPVFYKANRVGRNMRPIQVYKFRTMLVSTGGPAVTRNGDPRITTVGRWLRASKLDELPQLINVIKGEMSLVGPRPEDPKYVRAYDEKQRRVLTVTPGITSLASVRFRHEEKLLEEAAGKTDLERYYVNEILPTKLAIELDYVQERSTRSDVKILAQTVKSLFS